MDGAFDPYAEWLGIEDKRRPLTNYQLLGLAPFTDNVDAIESHEQQQLAKLVPFFKGEHALQAKRIAFEIKSAKICLLNPTTKASYDAGLRGSKPQASGAQPTPPAEGKPSPPRQPTPVVAPKQTSAPKAKPEPETEENCYALAQPEPCFKPIGVPTRRVCTRDVSSIQPKRQSRGKKSHWLIPAVAGGAVAVVACITFMLASRHAKVEVANAQSGKTRNVTEVTKRQPSLSGVSTSPKNPIPPPPNTATPTRTDNGTHRPSGMPTFGARWLNTSYDNTLVYVGGTSWIQVNNKNRNDVDHFTEVARAPQYIEIRRTENHLPRLLRIYPNRLEGSNGGQWAWVSNGHWEKNQTNEPAVGIEASTPTALKQALAAIEVTSPSFGSGGHPAIIINRQEVRHGLEPFGRGLFVVALVGGRTVLHQCFWLAAAANQFAEAIGELPEGAIVIVVAGDDATQNFNQNAQQAILSIGGRIGLLGKPPRSTYYCIGQKGLRVGMAIEAIGQQELHFPANRAFRSDVPLPNESYSPNSLRSEGGDSERQIDRVSVSHGKVQITLPSGAVLTESMLNVPKGWQKTLFPEEANVFPGEANVFVAKYPDNSVQGVFSLKKTKLHGAAAMLYENGHLQTLAVGFSDGLLDGCLRQWGEDGKRIFYAEYRKGRKHGMLCFFQDGMPWLIQECDKGKSQNEYLVKWAKDIPRILPTALLTGGESEEMSRACQQLATLEETMHKNEVQLKIKLAEWYRKVDKKIKQQRAAEHSVDSRAATSNRISAHNFKKAAATEASWRTALSHSGF